MTQIFVKSQISKANGMQASINQNWLQIFSQPQQGTMCGDEGPRLGSLGSYQRGVKVGFDSIMPTFSVQYANHMTRTLVCGVCWPFLRDFSGVGRAFVHCLSVGAANKQ